MATITQDKYINAFYITFCIIAMIYTTVMIIAIIFNKDIFMYIFMTYILVSFIYLHIVSIKNRNKPSTNAFFSLKQTSIIYIFNYISIVAIFIAYIVMNKVRESKKSFF